MFRDVVPSLTMPVFAGIRSRSTTSARSPRSYGTDKLPPKLRTILRPPSSGHCISRSSYPRPTSRPKALASEDTTPRGHGMAVHDYATNMGSGSHIADAHTMPLSVAQVQWSVGRCASAKLHSSLGYFSSAGATEPYVSMEVQGMPRSGSSHRVRFRAARVIGTNGCIHDDGFGVRSVVAKGRWDQIDPAIWPGEVDAQQILTEFMVSSNHRCTKVGCMHVSPSTCSAAPGWRIEKQPGSPVVIIGDRSAAVQLFVVDVHLDLAQVVACR